MRLLVVVLIILAFLAGLAFLQSRRLSAKTRSFLGFPLILLLVLTGMAFVVVGKLAVLFAALFFVLFLLTRKRV